MAAATSTDPVNPPGRMGLGRKPGQLLGVLAVKPLYTPERAARAEAWGVSADFHSLLGFCELMHVKCLHEMLDAETFD